jgi:type II secretory pathway component PulJ
MKNKKVLFQKGFALTQVLLAIALGAIVATGVVYYYNSTAKDQVYNTVAANVINSAEISQEENVIGNTTTNSLTVNGYTVSVSSGTATISPVDQSACSSIASQLKSKGQVTATCNNTNASLNKIVFTPVNTVLASQSEQTFNAGTPDNNPNSSVNNANLSGTYSASGSKLATGSTGSVFTSNGTTLPNNTGLSGGGNGGLGAGAVKTSPTSSAPSSSTGSTSLACSYYLTQPAYQTTSLGTRTTPCASGYASTSDQTGTETWSCPNPNSATLPVSTDTWTGGSCAIICVPASPKYQNIACPTGEYGTEEQEATSSCPAYTGNPVYGPWVTIATSNCHPDCSPPATTTSQNYQWVNEDPGCPTGDTGTYTYQEQQVQTVTTSYSCPSVSSSPVANTTTSGWSNTGNTQNTQNTCVSASPPVVTEANVQANIYQSGDIMTSNWQTGGQASVSNDNEPNNIGQAYIWFGYTYKGVGYSPSYGWILPQNTSPAGHATAGINGCNTYTVYTPDNLYKVVANWCGSSNRESSTAWQDTFSVNVTVQSN